MPVGSQAEQKPILSQPLFYNHNHHFKQGEANYCRRQNDCKELIPSLAFSQLKMLCCSHNSVWSAAGQTIVLEWTSILHHKLLTATPGFWVSGMGFWWREAKQIWNQFKQYKTSKLSSSSEAWDGAKLCQFSSFCSWWPIPVAAETFNCYCWAFAMRGKYLEIKREWGNTHRGICMYMYVYMYFSLCCNKNSHCAIS